MQPTRFYICNNTHSTLGMEEVLKGVWGGGGGSTNAPPRLLNAREVLRGSMASSIYWKKNCHFVKPGVWTREKGPVSIPKPADKNIMLLLLLLCEILLLRISYHHGLLAVYGKKFGMFCMCVLRFATTEGFRLGMLLSLSDCPSFFLIQEWDTNDIENK
jgi:hypothetical protein